MMKIHIFNLYITSQGNMFDIIYSILNNYTAGQKMSRIILIQA